MTFEIVKAEEKDYELFASIIQEVYEAMEEKEWFAADNAEYTYEMLKYSNGVGYKAIHQLGRGGWNFTYDISWGFRGNLGRDIGLSESELLLVAHMDSVAILPEYRGAGLQKRLMQHAEQELAEQGYRYFMCTVHPENRYSRQNIIKQGFKPVKTALKYGGYRREIFLRDRSEGLD